MWCVWCVFGVVWCVWCGIVVLGFCMVVIDDVCGD